VGIYRKTITKKSR